MVLIIGPGRSGTSVLALLYKELGFDPGGVWREDTRSGLEDPEIVALNEEILEFLGLSPMGAPTGASRRIRRAGKSLVPARYRSRIRKQLGWLPWMASARVQTLGWDRFDGAVQAFRERIGAAASRREVAKDPRFLWTLPVWAASEAPLQHAVITFRNLDAVIKGRAEIDSVRYHSEAAIRDSVVYGLGLTTWATQEWRLTHEWLRFPGFLDDPDLLFQLLRFPRPVSQERFVEVFNEVRRPGHIHDRR